MIAIDWGSSSLRAFRLDARGHIIEQRRETQSLLACRDRFEAVLMQLIAGWDDGLIVLAGMVGSRQGWVEVPYGDCPASLPQIAAGMVQVAATGLRDRKVWIVPGLIYRGEQNGADVLRGEEAQLCGFMQSADAGSHIVCMPGTHSKWAMVENGRVESFFTAMTGEVFDILCQHSLLGKLMSGTREPLDKDAFVDGMARARQSGGLLHHLFSVRTSGLLGTLQPAQLSSYLSGLLIAHELLDSGWSMRAHGRTVHLIGAAALVEAYALALQRLDVVAQLHGETLAAEGMFALARAAGLQEEAEGG